MELKDAILNRRSVKVYNSKPVDQQEVIDLLNIAVYAPTHQTRQPWRFVYIDAKAKEKLLGQLDQIYAGLSPEVANLDYRKRVIGGANALLVVINQVSATDPILTHEEFGATASLIQNFSLLAHERQLGVCWKTRLFSAPLAKHIGVQDNEMITGVLTLGHYDMVPPRKERIKVESKLTLL